jgi:hypothetical protein
MAGSDNYDQMDEALMENFGKKDNAILKEVDRLSKEQANLERDLASLSNSEVR